MPGCFLRIALGLALALGAFGCAFGGQEDRPVEAEQLEELLNAPGVPLYFAGRSFAGLPLTHAERNGQTRALFVYGTCDVEDPDGFLGPEGGSCGRPSEVQIFPLRVDDWRPGVVVECHRRPSLRGVPTVRHDGLVLFTSTIGVKIYGRSPSEERRVARALRALDGSVPPEADLPPPAFDVETILSPCS
ncbi:MAG: hypothetical protein ACR2L0_06420 [Gaiellaceae bacterium]